MSQTKHLIYEYQNNNELDLDRIMNDFEPYIRTIINNMAMNTLNYEDKEEILSDAFFILWKNQCKIQTSVESYIAGVTRILVKERLRKRKITYDLTECENIASDFEIMKNDISENEFIVQCINGLKEIDIKIITMFYYYSKTTKEISKELKISEINVRTKLFRIRNKIRKELNS
ncbi:MAG: sigma-70 family RNA polymerase sigma factor [Clostridia bacterium]|nr:sigma-70 family RNA polymerase sigma factor [Clostridia bacterium]